MCDMNDKDKQILEHKIKYCDEIRLAQEHFGKLPILGELFLFIRFMHFFKGFSTLVANVNVRLLYR